MNEKQFNEAAEYANKQLKDWQVAEALDFLNNRMPIPDETAAILYDAMEEWCDDNGLPEGAWMEWGDIEDVFFAYDNDKQAKDGIYTIGCGVMQDDELVVSVACKDMDEAMKVAYCIYRGEVSPSSNVGVLTITHKGNTTILIDRM